MTTGVVEKEKMGSLLMIQYYAVSGFINITWARHVSMLSIIPQRHQLTYHCLIFAFVILTI